MRSSGAQYLELVTFCARLAEARKQDAGLEAHPKDVGWLLPQSKPNQALSPFLSHVLADDTLMDIIKHRY